MSFNRVSVAKDTQASTSIPMDIKQTWKELVEDTVKTNKLFGVTCSAYSKQDKEINDDGKICPCGRLAHRHSFDGPAERQKDDADFTEDFLGVQKMTVYGQLSNEAKVSNVFITSGDLCILRECFLSVTLQIRHLVLIRQYLIKSFSLCMSEDLTALYPCSV